MAINVQGSTFDLYTPDTDTLDQAASMAAEYSTLITRTPSAPENPVVLRAIFQRLTVQFSRAEADRIALADAAGEQLKCDITHWHKVENVIEEHHARHRENGRNQERATKFLANDPQFNIVKQNITDGGHIDTPPDFERARPIEPFRCHERAHSVHHRGKEVRKGLDALPVAKWMPFGEVSTEGDKE